MKNINYVCDICLSIYASKVKVCKRCKNKNILKVSDCQAKTYHDKQNIKHFEIKGLLKEVEQNVN